MSELRLRKLYPFFRISAFRGNLTNPHLTQFFSLLRGALGLGILILLSNTSSFGQTIFTSNAATGNWNAPGSWLQTGTVDADGIPDNGDFVTILSGHTITLNVNSAASTLTINTGAVLSSTGTSTFTVTTLSVDGTYNNGSTGAITATSVNVNAGGLYVHGINGGTIPSATWAPTSTCSITGITATTPGGAAQTFGNVLWNSTQSSNINFTPNAISGNFEITNTGAFQVRLNGSPRTVSGNLIINGGDFAISSGATRTLNVTGNVIITSGTLDISRSTFPGILNVTGDFSHTGGLITETGTGTALITFNKTGTQTYISGGTVSNTVSFTVNSGTTLQMDDATTAITGAGTFILSSGATLGIRSTAGITSAGATGNIQTTTRNYSTSANYIYNGSANQNAGNGLPATVANLTIDNSGGGGNNTVSLPASKAISSVLNVNNGILALGANNITSVGSIDMTGTSITGTGTITLAGNVTTNVSSNTATISSPIALGAASRTFAVADGAASPDLTISSVIGGTSGIVKTGNGLLNLSGVNTYAGTTTINTGTLRVGLTGGAIPNTSAVTVSGTLDLGGNDETIGSLSGAGSVTSSAAGTVTLTTGGDNTSTNFSGIVDNGSGTVAIAKQGTGVFTLSGVNTYSGLTSINTGTLRLGSPSALGAVAAGTVVASGGTLDLNGINYSLAELLTLNGTGVSGSGVLINSNASLATYSGNVTLGSSGTITTSNDITLSGAFSGTFDLTKNGAGTLSFGANPVSVIGLNVSSGTFTATSGLTTISGNFINSGSFNHNGGTVLYNAGTLQTIAAVNYNNLSLSGAGQKNATGNTDVTGGLTNASVFNVAGNTITVIGAIANTGTIRFSGAANGLAVNTGTIEYYGPSQTITPGTYNNLTINQSSGQAIAGGDLLVNGVLALNAGNLNLIGANILTFGASSSVTGASSSKMIIATNGSEVRKTFVTTGSFVFPIGDNTSGVDYSPVTVNVTSAGGFSSAYVGVYVVDAKHPSNASPTHFLSRYWNITQSGITSCVATITGNYVATDINGTEGSSSSGQLTGTFNQLSNPWIKYATPLGTNTLNATGALLATGQISSFTGITGASPVASITGGAPICLGSSVALNTNVAGGDPVLIYSWSPALGLSATNVPNPTANPATTTTYTVTVTDANGISDTDNVLITVNTPPTTPTVNTTGNTICDGDPDITLTSSVAPNGGTYAWYKDGVSLGVVSSFININDVPNSGSYTVTVTDGLTNCSSAQSAPQVVTINALPLDKGVSAATSSTICDGGTITVRISASESGINYELQDQSNGSLSGIFAGTGSDLDITTSALFTGVSSIKVIATHAGTLCRITLSGTITPVINTIPTTPVVTPAGTVVQCVGSGTITLTSSAGSTYQWYKDGIVQVTETGPTIVIADAVSGSGSYQVRVYGVSPTACASALSSAVSVTIKPMPGLTATNNNPVFCSGGQTNITLSDVVTSSQISIFNVSASNAGLTGFSPAGSIYASGSSITDLLTNSTNSIQTVTYTLRSSYNGCTDPTDEVITVTVNPNPSFSITNTTAAICSGSSPVISVSSPTSGAVITLQSVNYGALTNGAYATGGTFGTGGSLSEGNLTNLTNNPIVVTYTFSVSTTATPSCPLVVSTQQTTVTVQPAPSFTITNIASSICSGSKTDLTLNTPVSGGQIRLKSVTYGAVTGSLTAGALYADGQTISETLVNTTNAPVTVQYEFESFAGTCGPGAPTITTVTVNPNPSFSITNTTAAICSGSSPVISVSSPTSGAVITLQSVNYGALTNGAYATGGTFGTGGSLSEGNLTNLTNNPIVVTYTFSVSTTATPSCPLVVSTQVTTVTVQPAPSFTITNVASSICSGSKTDLTLNTPVSGGQIRLKSVTYGAVTGSLTAGALYADGQTITETLVNTTNAPVTVQYEFESFAGTCGPGAPTITTVTVNPNPSFSITNTTAAICSGSSPVISVSSPTSGAVITLQSVNYGALTNGAYATGGTFGTGGSLSEGNLTNVTNNPIVVTYTFSVSTTATPSCPLVVSTQVTTVTVQPSPAFTITNIASSICSGSKTDLTLNTPVSGGQIRLKSVTYGAVTGSLTAGALYADGQTISETLVNSTNAPITVQYEFESFAGSCGPGAPTITTVTVNPNPSFSITNTTAAICSGSSPVISVSSPTSGAVITLQSVNYGALSNGAYATGGTFGTGGSLSEGNLTNLTNNPIVVTYTFSVSTTATPSCPLVVSTQQTTVTVQPAPSFTITNIASSICSGSKTDLTLNTPVSGGQIRLKSVTYGAVTGSLTAGALYADGQTITETLVNTTNAPVTVQYEFESFAGTCGPGAPTITTVTVNPNPSFSITNTTAAICSGSSPVISVSSPTSGAVITLQSVNYGALTNGAYATGGTFGTGGSLSEGNLTNVTNNPIVVTYTFSVSTTATPSCPLVVSTQVTTVTVQPSPSFSITNVASSICSGSKTDLTLNTPVSGGQIRLKSVTYGAVTGSLTAGALYADGQTITETLVNTTNAPVTVQYEFESFAGTCGPGAPTITTVTVNPNPSFSITNTTAAICSGSSPVISVSSPTSGAVITLQSVNYGALTNGAYATGGTFGTGGSLSEGNLTNVTNNPIVVTYTFSVSTTATPSCPLVVSTQVTTVTVQPSPSFSITNVASSICSGSKTDLTLNTPVSGGQIRLKSVTYGAVTGSLTAGALYADGQTITETLVNTTNAPVTVQYEFESFAGTCGPGAPTITTVTVNPNPSFSITNTTAAICSGSSPVISVSSPTSGAVITLQSVNYGALTNGAYATGGTFGTGGSLSEGNLTNATNNPIVVTYTFSVSTTATPSCPLVVGTQVTTVTVQPAPSFSITNVASSICSGSKTDLTLNTPVSGGQIRLKSVTYGAVTGSLTAGALYADGQTISETLVNTTNAPVTVQYEFESFAGTCGPGAPTITTVTVNPNPSFSITNTTAAICSGSSPVISVSSPTSGAVITLQSVNYGALTNGAYATGGTFGTGGSLSEGNLTNVTNNPIVVTYTFSVSTTATPSCPLVVSTQVTTVTVDPIPTVVFFGLPAGGPPPQIAENSPTFKVSGTQKGGLFTISPGIGLGNTVLNPTDEALFDPDAATIYDGHPSTINTITYTYTNENGCTNSSSQSIIVNAITSVDFAIQGATLDGSNNYELCAELGQVKLLGFPDPSTGLSGSFESLTPGLTITSSGSNYFIETNGLVSGTYDIKYTYTNVVNATSFRIRTVKIYASPVAQLTSSNNCIISDVVFTDTSTINPTPFATSLASWQWNFGDNDFSTIQNPSKRYTTSNTYYVTLKVTTLQGCSNTSAATAHPVRVGDVPIVNYDWSAICTNDNTNFFDRTTKVQGATPSGISTITSYTWNFGDGDILTAGIGAIPAGTHNGKTFGTFKDPNHNYSVNGTYTATLTVDTNDGCSSTKSQNIFILPAGSTVTPQSGVPYLADFEANDAGWVPEANSPSDTSWIWGLPTGDAIKTAASGSKAWWTGKNDNTYYPLEHSVINGPCFDLTQLDRPMVAIDYWSDLEKDVDGAVLQYSIDGGLSWRIVGPAEGQSNRDEGINWFNSAAIISNPGGQAIGPYGWTNKIGKWTNGRFNLDMIPPAERDQVRLRIAFSSNDGNPTTNNVFYDGFAFDNFFVGDKTKNVLVEHFTDGNSKASVDGDEYLDNLYQKQFTLHGISDFNDIRYHISSGSVPDPLNQDNQADPGARATYMGVSQPPTTLMDGILNNKFTGKYTDLDDKGVELDRRALEDPLFDLALDTVATGVNNTIKVNLTITSRKIYNEPLIAQVVLMENSIGNFHNVLRKALFGSDGQVITNAFIAGQSKVETNLETEINVPIVNSNQLSLIGYVQNKNTREIYQSIKIAAPGKKGRIIVGLEDEVIPTTLNGITIFPNPADGVFNFGIPDPNSIDGYSWKLSDQRGVIVRSGDFQNSFDGRKQVDISGLPNAVYFVIITGPGHSVVYRKLVILNKS